MSRKLIEEINKKINITEIVENYLTLKRTGNGFIGLCPFHNEKTPSFSVTPESNLFYCFGCHKGGDMIKFVMEIEHMDFQDALRFLAQKAGISIENYYSKSSNIETKERQSLSELYKKVTLSFSYILKNKPEADIARNYLSKRGLTESIINEFQIGWAPEDRNWLLRFLRKKNYSDDFLKKSGLFSQKGLNRPLFAGRIMFPLKNQNGDIIAFSGRTLNNMGPKYINSPETLIFKKKYNFFGLGNAISFIRKKKEVIICEGQMDVIAYHQAGFENTVAPLGTSFTEEQATLLKRYTDKAIISFDGDEAGKKAMLKAIILCENHNIRTEVVQFNENEDPSELIQYKGVEALQNLLKSNINSFDFVLKNAIDLYDVKTPEGKERIIQQMSNYINSISSDVRREGCIREISDKLGINYTSVLSDIKRGDRFQKRKKQENDKINSNNKGNISSDLFLMIAIVANPEKFTYVRSKINEEDIYDIRAKEIYIALEESFRNEETELGSIMSRISSDNVKALLAEKISSGEFNINSEDLIKDMVKKIKKSVLLKKRKEVEQKLRFMSNDNKYPSAENELLSEKIFIDKEIEKLR